MKEIYVLNETWKEFTDFTFYPLLQVKQIKCFDTGGSVVAQWLVLQDSRRFWVRSFGSFSMEFACPLCSCVVSLQVLQLPPKTCTQDKLLRLK